MKEAVVGGLGGFALGAGLMYLSDPAWGRRRRSLVRDKAVHGAHRLEEAASRTSQDLAHRTAGLGARIQRLFDRAIPDDRVLEERVRARLGRLCTHPHALDVYCQDGRVELSGVILKAEL